MRRNKGRAAVSGTACARRSTVAAMHLFIGGCQAHDPASSARGSTTVMVLQHSNVLKDLGLNEPGLRAFTIQEATARGRFYVGEPVAMRRPTELVPLDRTMQLSLTLAGGLRTTFADVVSSPLPNRLTALMRRLHADRDERLGEDKWGKGNRNVEPY